jgi:hypothetical protein
MRLHLHKSWVLAVLTAVPLVVGVPAAQGDQSPAPDASGLSSLLGASGASNGAQVSGQTSTATENATGPTASETATSPSDNSASAPASPPQPGAPSGSAGQSDAAGGSDQSNSSSSNMTVGGSGEQTSPTSSNTTAGGSDQQTSPASSNTTAGGSDQQTSPASSNTTAGGSGQQNSPTTTNSTRQEIWQVQSLGCSAHCQGLTQSQSAQQLNTTVQAAAWAGPATEVGSSPTSDTADGSTNVTQIQIGCVSQCFGSTTTGSAAQPVQSDLAQFIAAQTPPDLPDQEPLVGSQENFQDQTSYQSQVGPAGGTEQSQSAQQTGLTVQGLTLPADGVAALSSMTSSILSTFSLTNLMSALSQGSLPGWLPSSSLISAGGLSIPTSGSSSLGSDSPFAAGDQQTGGSAPQTMSQVVNQVEQAIWQIQIGCLVFCVDTNQQQLAQQSDTTLSVLPTPAAPGDDAASATSHTYQLVWQLQIGCLFWCVNAVETQTATIVAAVTTLVPAAPPLQSGPPPASGPSASPPAIASAGSSTPPASNGQQAPPVSPPISSPLGSATVSPPPEAPISASAPTKMHSAALRMGRGVPKSQAIARPTTGQRRPEVLGTSRARLGMRTDGVGSVIPRGLAWATTKLVDGPVKSLPRRHDSSSAYSRSSDDPSPLIRSLESQSGSNEELYPEVVDVPENEGGVPSRLIKTDSPRRARKEGTPWWMFARFRSRSPARRSCSRSTISPVRELGG